MLSLDASTVWSRLGVITTDNVQLSTSTETLDDDNDDPESDDLNDGMVVGSLGLGSLNTMSLSIRLLFTTREYVSE